MGENITVFISEEKIKNRINEIAVQLNELYKNETVTLICTLKGAVIFAADLMRRLNMDVRLEFVAVSS
ncbi:MAG: hypoxanthine phosphoribosyltransferase, partial [Firmicutes bacterium]|nr:hypoxanthine phosphoribosyltransferase [Bacillota bacterium]